MADSQEIRIKPINIEYDGSGMAKAVEELKKLAAMKCGCTWQTAECDQGKQLQRTVRDARAASKDKSYGADLNQRQAIRAHMAEETYYRHIIANSGATEEEAQATYLHFAAEEIAQGLALNREPWERLTLEHQAVWYQNTVLYRDVIKKQQELEEANN